MLKFLGKLPHKVGVACSGGVDSMAVIDFLNNGKRDLHCMYFNHGTEHSIKTQKFVEDYCLKHNIPLHIGYIKGELKKRQSLEEFWRNERYAFLNSFDMDIITCHHLDDQVENWVFSSINGSIRLIPYRNKNIIRPFIVTEKADFTKWCVRRNVEWMDDHSNTDLRFARNRIRHRIIPEIKLVNPGINKVVKKKVIEEFESLGA
jgi:tRNA(Ile)-lysidine synthase